MKIRISKSTQRGIVAALSSTGVVGMVQCFPKPWNVVCAALTTAIVAAWEVKPKVQ
jgi:hypothetical protein